MRGTAKAIEKRSTVDSVTSVEDFFWSEQHFSYRFWMLLLKIVLIGLLTSLPSLLAIDVEGALVIPGGTRTLANTRVVLNGGEYSSLSSLDGSFTFYDVDAGIYLLEVLCVEFAFPQMKVKIENYEDNTAGSISVVEYKYPGANRTPGTHPIKLVALTPLKYFQDPPRFNILGFLMGNPMILITVLSAGMMYLFPKMLQNMDPEAMKEFEKVQETEDPMEALKKMMSLGS